MNQPEPASRPPTAYRSVAFVAGGIAVLLVAVVAVVLLVGDREPDLERGTPQAALAEYLTAFDAGDLEAAHAHFSADLRARWDLDAYRRSVDAYGFHGQGTDVARRILFDSAETRGDVVRVRLTIEEFYGEGLSGDTYRSSREIRMVREGGAWRIDEPLVWLDPAPTTLP